MTVYHATSGPEAIKLFRSNHDDIDLVILDVQMPGMDGLKTMGHLRDIQPDVKVILSSGYTKTQMPELRKFRNLVGFLQKPYDTVTLLRVINSAISETFEEKPTPSAKAAPVIQQTPEHSHIT